MSDISASDRAGLRLLYIEDNEDARDVLSLFLQRHGFEVVGCGTAADGLDAIRDQRFDLVISDFNLPDDDGITLLTQAAEAGWLHCASIILTGAFRIPATTSRVVKKPIDPPAFLTMLDDILELTVAPRTK